MKADESVPWLDNDSPRRDERYKIEVRHHHGYLVQFGNDLNVLRGQVQRMLWTLYRDSDTSHDVTLLVYASPVGKPMYSPDLDMALTIIDRDREEMSNEKGSDGATGHNQRPRNLDGNRNGRGLSGTKL